MTVTTQTVTVTVDGVAVEVPAGTLIIRVAEMLGTAIPRFCDHPLLSPVAACRACLVEIEGQGKPQPACAIPVTDGMVVKTQHTSDMAQQAQAGVMEFLLINHPLDCPVCDKGGECPLQNQAMANGRGESRFDGTKRSFPKPINVSAQVLLDRERCVSCARCTRFAEQIAGDQFIALLERGAKQQVGTSEDQPFDSYFSGNTIQICPVGALTSAKYRFRSRPFDLVSTPSACEHCASGCALRTDVRRGSVMRRLAWDAPEVNEEWNCDKGRFAFPYLSDGRLTSPLVRDEDGNLVPASWPEALRVAAAGLKETGVATGVLTGGRVTVEDAKAYAAFARGVLGTNDVDFRARAVGAEETAFLAHHVAGKNIDVTYGDLEVAPSVLLVGLDPEDESPIVFLRLRKAALQHRTKVVSVAPYMTAGLAKMKGTLIAAGPFDEATAISGAAEHVKEAGSIILVGERAATSPGALKAVADLAASTGARLAWVPRRAGDRGAVDAGLLPINGRDITTILSESGKAVKGLLVGGVSASDVDGDLVAAVDAAQFVVSLETRHSDVTERADVVLPVAVVTEKAGTFRNWEGRDRSFNVAIPTANVLSDADVLTELARELGVELDATDFWATASKPELVAGTHKPTVGSGQAVLATWKHLLDKGTLQEGEPYLAATSRVAVIRVSPATARSLNLVDGGQAKVECCGRKATAPVIETAGMADGVVWIPSNSEGAALNLPSGCVVNVSGGVA